VRFRHVNGGSSLAFSADGKTLASGGSESIRLWSVPSGKELRRFETLRMAPISNRILQPSPCVGGLHFTAEGKLLALINYDNTVILYEPSTGKSLMEFSEGENHRLAFGAFSADGKSGAAVNMNRAGLPIWNLITGTLVRRIEDGFGDSIPYSPAFSPDGKVLATCDFGNKSNLIRLWDLSKGELQRLISLERCMAHALAFSPDGKTLAVACGTPFALFSSLEIDNRDSKTVLIDLATGKEKRVLCKSNFDCLAFSPDGKILAAGGNGVVRLIDVVTGADLARQDAHSGPVTALAYSAGGDKLLTAGDDDTIRTWNPLTSKQLTNLDLARYSPYNSAFTSDGKLFAFMDHEKVAHLWDIGTGKELRQFGKQSKFPSTILSANGRTLGVHSGGTGTFLRLWDTGTGREFGDLSGRESWHVTLSPDGSKVAEAAALRIRLRDVASGKQLWSAEAPASESYETVMQLRFSPDGKCSPPLTPIRASTCGMRPLENPSGGP
jgi:WD40 repeat protein